MRKPNLKMLDLFVDYINKREAVYHKQQKGLPRPWTTDPILAEGKFTNVYRAWDRTTKHFVDRYYKPHGNAPAEQIAFNCAMFRWFGTTDFADAIGWQTTFDEDQLIADVQAAEANGVKVWTGGYKISPGGGKIPKGTPKEEYVIPYVLASYNEHIPQILDACQTRRKQRVHTVLKRLEGFGDFMAKEVIEDMCLTPLLQDATDSDTFTPVGQGAVKGLTKLYGNCPRALQLRRIAFLRDEIEARCGLAMTAHDVQFNLCEFGKYVRVWSGEGKMKSNYVPHESRNLQPKRTGFF